MRRAVAWLSILLGAALGGPIRAAAEAAEIPWEGTQPAARIVSLSPSVTEILFAIGAGGRVAGVSKQCDFPMAAKLKPKAGEFNRPDLDAIGSLNPDLVLFTEYVRPEDLAALADAGIRSAVLPARSVADIVDTVRKLGEVTGEPGAAEDVAAKMESVVREIRQTLARVPEADRPSVYVEVDGPPHPLYAVGPGSFMGDVIRLAGGRNVFAEASSPYFLVEPEDVIRADPEVILIDHPFQYKVGLSKRPGWSDITAVKNGRVYDNADYDIILLNRPSPRIVESLREVSRILHPEVWNAE